MLSNARHDAKLKKKTLQNQKSLQIMRNEHDDHDNDDYDYDVDYDDDDDDDDDADDIMVGSGRNCSFVRFSI